MNKEKENMNVIDQYINEQAEENREKLFRIREIIKNAAPDAEERISWAMPTFTSKTNIAHFAAHKKHIGFYPGPDTIVEFKDKLTKYKTSKGAVQFPYTEALPEKLISEMVSYNYKKYR